MLCCSYHGNISSWTQMSTAWRKGGGGDCVHHGVCVFLMYYYHHDCSHGQLPGLYLLVVSFVYCPAGVAHWHIALISVKFGVLTCSISLWLSEAVTVEVCKLQMLGILAMLSKFLMRRSMFSGCSPVHLQSYMCTLCINKVKTPHSWQ